MTARRVLDSGWLTIDSERLVGVAFHQAHGTTRTLASLVTDQLDRMAASVRTIAELIHGDAGTSIALEASARARTPTR